MTKRTLDVDFLTMATMTLASDVAERFPDDKLMRPLLDAMLRELGVATPYPPTDD
ncbi:hypothetical protein JQ615_11990 [Bradyrhizobium jicamae]|uniref:Uncharacterized protein n=1 Tax=Bradyrhizobium jicamae TaxID=280332 RepID=A0ABS5FH56_9BRAD|nr:hypothetical protein [Bradyrhizobium jicamae]MBR0796110.1 hypothetical protein [Bradyrhizobium jicamae]